MGDTYDFSGWATRNNLKCSDGRTIMKDAFKDNDGATVPLVWNHQHNNPENVLGHALLENRSEGVYAYCTFNDTENGQNAKLLVQHGDVSALSIFANKLKQNGGNVLHGAIREVSLVLAGANPGAVIENIMAHSDDDGESAILCTGDGLTLFHSDVDDESVEDVLNSLNEKQRGVVEGLLNIALEHSESEQVEESIEHADGEDEKTDKDKTIGDVVKSMTDEQQLVLHAIVGSVLQEQKDSEGEEKDMKHNVFDGAETQQNEDVLSHSDMAAIVGEAKRAGSMKEAFLAHGIENIEILFPDAKTTATTPDFIKREMGWVSKVMSGTHHTPFSRIKSIHADITEDDARALGYLGEYKRDAKGNKVLKNGENAGKPAYKKEEVFSLLKRTTTPTTIYKKQKLDRDDVIDITDFDVVSWIKGEMRMMLDEEIARAILVGDGRLGSSDDKINESNIRPIYTDTSNDLYAIQVSVGVAKNATEDDRAKAFIRKAIKSRKNYKGTGNPTLFTTEDMLTDMLLLEDGIGHRLYKTEQELATALRVKEIVTVPVMENITRTAESKEYELAGIIVNLADYNVGADKGGNVSFFDDFDIDYNAQKYLIETRISGALVKPKSAMVIEFVEEEAATANA